jgi:hypothetical protein
MPYVIKRRRRYWSRFQIPADVSDAFDGKRELWVNLNTEDYRQAEARASREASEFRARVLEARGRVGSVEEDALRWRREPYPGERQWRSPPNRVARVARK